MLNEWWLLSDQIYCNLIVHIWLNLFWHLKYNRFLGYVLKTLLLLLMKIIMVSWLKSQPPNIKLRRKKMVKMLWRKLTASTGNTDVYENTTFVAMRELGI